MMVDIDLAGVINALDDDQFDELLDETRMTGRVTRHAVPFFVGQIAEAIADSRDDSIRALVEDGDWTGDVAHMRALARTLTEMADEVEMRGAKKRGGTR